MREDVLIRKNGGRWEFRYLNDYINWFEDTVYTSKWVDPVEHGAKMIRPMWSEKDSRRMVNTFSVTLETKA
jgi:hypothetical protein